MKLTSGLKLFSILFSTLFGIGVLADEVHKKMSLVDMGLGTVAIGFILYLWLVLK